MNRRQPRTYARVSLILLVSTLIAGGFSLLGSAALGADAVDGVYAFTGVPEDQANKAAADPTATFSEEAPSGDTINQVATNLCNEEVSTSVYCAYWVGPYTGEVVGDLELCWYWTSTNPAAIALGSVSAQVTVWADPNLTDGTGTVIGQQEIEIAVGPEPTQSVAQVAVEGEVAQTMLIQVGPTAADTGQGLTVQYGSEDAPSAFGPVGRGSIAGGPSPSTSPSPSAGGAKHGRSIGLGFAHQNGRLAASGKVSVNDGFNACRKNVPVTLDRRKGDRWVTVGTDDTNRKGRYEVTSADKQGRFRARALKQRKSGDVCKPAVKVKRHDH